MQISISISNALQSPDIYTIVYKIQVVLLTEV